MDNPVRLTKAFFDRPTEVVARALLGQVLVHGDKRAVIVETEAYMKRDDEASHAYMGRKLALEAFAKGPGTIYTHPMRPFKNAVGIDLVAADGSVLLRGLDLPDANGPAKLNRAMGIGKALHTLNVTDPDCPLWLEEGVANGEVVAGPRFGIKKETKATDLPLRFMLKPVV
ncbi:MAG TPA: DNA-3-methyladenine glycosylase [Alphaproteobacteria bacterium]|nr:DNA-3-methyladenine glycosylase [Alphaproteobacteria bacterium]